MPRREFSFAKVLTLTIGMALVVIFSGLLIGCAKETPPVATPVPVPSTQTPIPTVPSTPQPTATVPPAVISAPKDIKATTPYGVEYLNAVPMTQVARAKKGPVSANKPMKVPVITWGGDVATIYANGNNRVTQPGSIFSQKGLNIQLVREDNFVRAVEMVISGETPYLRGTLDMVNSALEALKAQGIEMVVVYQLTWSTGGDTIVVRSDAVKTAADLCGKNIGAQLYGPHMGYIATVLKDAGCPNGANIKWMRELTIPPYDTKGVAVDPMAAMQRDAGLAAVTVISPDMMALTSGGTVGTGAESSVKAAKLMLSTKTAGRVIADVYAVRKDYLDANRADVQAFVHGLLMAQEELTALFNARQQRQAEYQNLLRVSAELLRDSSQATADIEGLLMDATFVGYPGNAQFFGGQGTMRSFEVLTKEAQQALMSFGLMSGSVPLVHAMWDYNVLAQGLKDTAGVVAPRFDPVAVERLVKERERTGTTKEGVLFDFNISFQPNQNDFSGDLYRNEFDRVIVLASTYPGAIIIVEGHADPMKYLKEQKDGLPQYRLDQTKQAAKNLSLQRAIAVRDSVIAYAKARNLSLDTSQFTAVGAGIERPLYPNPQNEKEWRSNMRVVFQIIQVEAELQQFTPAGK